MGTDDYGTFHRDQTLNRGQAAAILSRILSPLCGSDSP